VNETLARTLFPAGDPVGKYIMNFGPIDGKVQIIGVVANVKHIGLEVTTRPEVYLPLGQTSWPSMYVTVRSASANPASLAAAVQDAVWSVDKNVPVSDVRAMKDVVAGSVLRRKFGMLLLTIFAVLALALTSIGIYGVMSYSVSRRTHEIGIRMALGAQRADVLSLIVRQGMVFAIAGIVLGTVASLGITRLMSDLLFGVSATDPVIFVGVTLLLASVALAANYIPARRAARVDPLVALHYE
jgi:putative ABC transport system permease protein